MTAPASPIDPSSSASVFPSTAASFVVPAPSALSPFHRVLFDQLRVGVIFVDHDLQITTWNRCLEQMTGISAATAMETNLNPKLFQLRSLDGSPLEPNVNPFANWCQSGQSAQAQYLVSGRSGRELQVEFSFYPVTTPGGESQGGVVILVDRSVQVELQRQLDQLHSQAVVDPLTRVANRAEFERLLVDYVDTHFEVGLKCSVIVCDLDYFKRINDNYGHHVGDQALVAFAQLLKSYVRTQDFVARYGGEEFVILCANCDERAALLRAEEIRAALHSTPQAMLENKTMTASFGVAELQHGDTPRLLFVRADQALLRAKEAGRNCVVAACKPAETSSSEATSEAEPTAESKLPTWPERKLPEGILLEGMFGTNCPPALMLRKIVAFCQQFAIGTPKATESSISFVTAENFANKNPNGQQLRIEMDVATRDRLPPGMRAPEQAVTLLRIAVLPVRSGWFRKSTKQAAEHLLRDLRGFLGLMGSDHEIRAMETFANGESGDRY